MRVTESGEGNARFSQRIGEDFEASRILPPSVDYTPFADTSEASSHKSRHLEGTDISLRN
jgi:hypothetical protein